jgi:Protein of unknown function (DUF664)
MTETQWTAPEVERADPPYASDERTMLEGWLDYQRQTLHGKCAGLTHEQLATRSVDPSSMSLLGLVRHMADVERWWFRCQFRGEDVDLLFGPWANRTGDFDDLDDTPAGDVLLAHQREAADADAAVAGHELDETFFNRRRASDVSLRWVYVHMIEEYARHNGHADLLRERIDGATGD